jgi:hypothetical protein
MAAGSGVCEKMVKKYNEVAFVVFHERKSERCQCDPRIDKSILQITSPMYT